MAGQSCKVRTPRVGVRRPFANRSRSCEPGGRRLLGMELGAEHVPLLEGDGELPAVVAGPDDGSLRFPALGNRRVGVDEVVPALADSPSRPRAVAGLLADEVPLHLRPAL